MLVRHELRRKYSQASWFIKSNEYSCSAFCPLCSQINLLLPREASGTSVSCSVPRDSHFPLLLNQEAVQSFNESWMLSIQRRRLLFTFRLFFSSSSQTPRCSHFSEDSTMSSQWNQLRETKLCFVFIITSYVYSCLGSICGLQIFRWLMNAWVQSSMWNGTQR